MADNQTEISKNKKSPSSKKPRKINMSIPADKVKIIEQVLGSIRVKFKEHLKYHVVSPTSFYANCFYVATTVSELSQALNLANQLSIPFFIFGAGTKILITEELEGLTIKNRTSGIKISGVKGKVSPLGIGVDEALVEVESGVSLGKVNEFLKEQKLRLFNFPFIANATIGGSTYVTPPLQDLIQKIKVWSDGQVFDIDILDLKRSDVILSVILRVKSAEL